MYMYMYILYSAKCKTNVHVDHVKPVYDRVHQLLHTLQYNYTALAENCKQLLWHSMPKFGMSYGFDMRHSQCKILRTFVLSFALLSFLHG